MLHCKLVSLHPVLMTNNNLTHCGRDRIDAISQKTFSNAFSWMKMYEFCLRFQRSLFLRFELKILQHWLRWWRGANQVTSHYPNQWQLIYWSIYASLELDGLMEIKTHEWWFPALVVIDCHRLLLNMVHYHTRPVKDFRDVHARYLKHTG